MPQEPVPSDRAIMLAIVIPILALALAVLVVIPIMMALD